MTTKSLKKREREKETLKLGSSYLGGKIYKGANPGYPRIKPAVVRMGNFFKKFFVFLAVPGLSCSACDLQCLLQRHVNS